MMKKTLISLSAVAALATTSYAGGDSDIAAQLAAMQKEIASLKSQLSANTASIQKVDKLAKKAGKQANHAKMLANGDNLKFSVDFRTSIDKINYKMTDGTTQKNDGLMTNRLWLKAAYAPNDNVSFRSVLAYNKAYGDTANHSQSNVNAGYANFDWVTNENALGNELKIKEAYWLYRNDTFLGNDVAWTASVGRRPSTGGMGINLREDEGEQSPLGHTINVEFDGASFRFNLDKVTPLTGGWVKLCMGRGLTNATPRFHSDETEAMTEQGAYSTDNTLHNNVDMIGFIFIPYDDGQYSVNTQYSVAKNMIGFGMTEMMKGMDGNTATVPSFQDVGDLELSNVMLKANGIGNEINDFLDNTNLVVSWAQSKTKPNALGMLGSTDSETGHSEWIALNMPAGEDARFGLEWNQGSKYWRPVTYGEDTMIGSKLAARGSAVEAYYNRKLTQALSLSLRATKIDYDYTGSNSFFGYDGTPDMKLVAAGMSQTFNAVEEAKDIRFAINYRY